MGGSSNGDYALVRYLPNGSPDLSFGVDGKVTTDFGGGSLDYARSLLIQNDGKIVLGGSCSISLVWRHCMARYLP